MRSALLLFALVGCPQSEPSEPPTSPVPDDPCEDAPDWAFASGYVRTWCTPCHSEAVVGAARQGAPAGLDFDTWTQIALNTDRVRARATGDAPDMPPVSGADPADILRLEEWLDCGAQGTDPTPNPCDALTWVQGRTVSNQTEADALCSQGNAVRGDLTTTTHVRLDCLCEVDGDFNLSGGTFPSLTVVHSDLAPSAGSSDLTMLHTVGGSVLLDESAATVLFAPALQSVGDDLTAQNTQLLQLTLPSLLTVGGRLTLTDSSLSHLDLTRIRDVQGEVTLERLPFLIDLVGFGAIEHIGGDLRIVETGLQSIDSFRLLSLVEGSITVENNAALVGLDGFTLLPTLTDLSVADNPALVIIDGFDNVNNPDFISIVGNVSLQRVFAFVNLKIAHDLTIANNPALGSLLGLSALEEVDQLTLASLPLADVPWFARLTTVHEGIEIAAMPDLVRISGLAGLAIFEGRLTVRDNPNLQRMDQAPALTAIRGTVALHSLPRLTSTPLLGSLEEAGGMSILGTGLSNVIDLDALSHVYGDLAVIGNLQLPSADAEAFAQELVVDGLTEVRDNGP